MLEFCIDAFSSISESVIFFMFLRLFLKGRTIRTAYKVGAFALLAVLHMVFLQLLSTSPIRFILSIVLDIGLAWVLFEATLARYLLFTGLFYVLIGILESVLFTALNIVLPELDVTGMINGYSLEILWLMLLLRGMELGLLFLIRRFKNRPVRKRQWRGLLLLPVATIVFMWLVFPRYWALKNDTVNQLLMMLAVFFVLQNIFVFSYIAAIQSSTEQYMRLQDAYDQQRQYYAALAAIQRTIRKMGHDLRHHFVYLMAALDQGDIPKARKYLIELDSNLADLVPVNITGHNDVDALLFAKAKDAVKQGVGMDVEGLLPPSLEISPVDLSVLLGNALDNAIRAATRVEGQKGITVIFGYRDGRMSYTVSNPYVGSLHRKPGGGYFSQRAGGGMGFGIMNEVVKKYGGAVATDTRDQLFTLTAILHIGTLKSDAPEELDAQVVSALGGKTER